MLFTISFRYLRRSDKIVSSEMIENSRKDMRRSSWNRVIARARGSEESG